jgi:hypothetical protein
MVASDGRAQRHLCVQQTEASEDEGNVDERAACSAEKCFLGLEPAEDVHHRPSCSDALKDMIR